MVNFVTRNGTVKTNASGVGDVNFPVPRDGVTYSISLAYKKESVPVFLSYSAKSAAGFKVHAVDAAGNPVNNVTVDWLVMPKVGGE